MKICAWSLLATTVILASGCRKNDEPKPDGVRTEPAIEPVPQPATNSVTDTGAAGFRWVAQSDSTWVRLVAAFRAELAETLGQVYVADAIERAGVFESSVLVVLRLRAPFTPVHRLYNYDLATGLKTVIPVESADRYGVWRGLQLGQLARFQPLQGPDVLVQHLSCEECEAESWLTSLHVEPSVGWRARDWRTVGKNVFVGSDRQYGEGVTWEYSCAEDVGDFDKDAGEELIVSCRVIERKGDSNAIITQADSMTIMTVSDGASIARQVTDPAEQKAARARICRVSKTSPLCRMVS